MSSIVAVSFFRQSSFAVAVGKTLLIFSYRELSEDEMPVSARMSDRDLAGFSNILVFVPRNSAEHFDKVIFSWKASFPITYILSSDVGESVPRDRKAHLVRENDEVNVAGARVRVCGSTDAGVSYLVDIGGIHVFHAGDLNLWHWREENTPQAIARAEEEFYAIVKKIPHDDLDICMFPLDPNQGGFYDAGANHIIMALKPRVFFPMHWGRRTEIANDYARRMHTRRTTVYALTGMRETVQIDLSQEPPAFFDPGREKQTASDPAEKVVTLGTYLEDNPFAETDLPVNLTEGKE